MQRSIHILSLTLTLNLLGACGGGKNDSDTEATDSAGTTGAGATEGTTTAGATEPTIGMSSAPTDSGDEASAGTSATSSTSGPDPSSASATDNTAGGMTDVSGGVTDTTGPVETTGAPPDLCMELCEKFMTCTQELPMDCVQDCSSELEGLEDFCKLSTEELYKCVNMMTCEQLVAFTEEEDPGPCAAQLESQGEACSDQICEGSVGTNEEGTECAYNVQCPDSPPQEFRCVGDTCTCLVDGKETGNCPAEGVCMNLDLLSEQASVCCGF